MTKYLVTCIVVDNQNFSKEVEANSVKEALDSVAIPENQEVLKFEKDYTTEYIHKSKIIKYIVVDLDEKEKADQENARRTAEALKTFSF